MASDKGVGTRDKTVEWYNTSLDDISDSTRDVLENYSKIPSDQVIPHCLKIVCQSPDCDLKRIGAADLSI